VVLCKWLHCDLWPFPQVSDPGPSGPSSLLNCYLCRNFVKYMIVLSVTWVFCPSHEHFVHHLNSLSVTWTFSPSHGCRVPAAAMFIGEHPLPGEGWLHASPWRLKPRTAAQGQDATRNTRSITISIHATPGNCLFQLMNCYMIVSYMMVMIILLLSKSLLWLFNSVIHCILIKLWCKNTVHLNVGWCKGCGV